MKFWERALEHWGYKLLKVRDGKIPASFTKTFKRDLGSLRKNPGPFRIFEEMRYNAGHHPAGYRDMECQFAAHHLSRLQPQKILDVGSYRFFVIGVLAGAQVTTLDVRSRKPFLQNETVITGDVKKLELPDESFDVIVSLCALEHFGLGRYGDEVDFEADHKAFKEMLRVLKPGGRLIFTTTITRAVPSILFNTHRVYNHDMIKGFASDMTLEDERFFNHKTEDYCAYEEVTDDPQAWNVYFGCWRK